MSAADFLDDENWHGGYYELAIDLGPRSEPESTARLRRALAAIWADDRLDGCFLERWTARDVQPRVQADLYGDGVPLPLYGTAQLPDGPEIVCAAHVVRETEANGSDWLDLCLPVGALSRADNRVGGFPAEKPDRSLDWRRPIDAWLVSIATRVHEAAGFDAAMIDWEISGVGLPEDTTSYKPTFLTVTEGQLVVSMAEG